MSKVAAMPQKGKKLRNLALPFILIVALLTMLVPMATLVTPAEAAVLDQSQTEGDLGPYYPNLSFDKYAQIFTPGISGKLESVSVYLGASNEGTQSVGTVEIYNVTSGKPSGTPIASSTHDMYYFYPDTKVWMGFSFSSQPYLTAGTPYALVLAATGGKSWWGTNTNPYDGTNNALGMVHNTTNWQVVGAPGTMTTPNPNIDFAFKTNMTPASSISIGDVSVAEGTGPISQGTNDATFTVTVSPASPWEIPITWTTVNGTATGCGFGQSTGDYWTYTGSGTIPANVSTYTITVEVVGDATPESSETFYLDISATNATVTDNQGMATILDDDSSLSINDVTQAEGSSGGTTNFNFTVTLSPASQSPVSVGYRTLGEGSASAGVDYTQVSGTLNFAANETTKTISVPVVGDTTYEQNENFVVYLENPVNATIADSRGTGLITNDDPLPVLSINDVTKAEGNSGTTNFGFTVTMSNPMNSNVTVNYATSNGTATAGTDYTTASGTLTIPTGATSGTITVSVLGDTTVESDETFYVTLSTPVNATLTGGDAQGLGTITNDDVVVLPSLSINDVSVNEGDSGNTDASFTVTLSSTSTSDVTVNYATANGTATAGTDYTSTSGTLTISAGNATGTISVPVIGDNVVESNETFYVNLSGASGATIADNQGLGTIINDDVPLSNLSINNVTVTEGDGGTTDAVFTVTLNPASSGTVTVDYTTMDGTATQPSDYTLTSGTLTFATGNTIKTIIVPVIGDTTAESNETFNVVLSNPTNAVITGATGVGTITDDDVTVGFNSSSYGLNESWGGTYAITAVLQLSKTSASDVTVNYTLSGTATYGVDYTVSNYTPGVGGSITIPASMMTQNLNFNIINDTLDEPNETIIVNLTGATNATVSGTTVFTGTIFDDDPQTATLSIDDVSVEEGSTGTTDAVFTVSLSAASGWIVTVHFATVNDTAIAGTDYNSASGDLAFNPGETSKTVTVQVLGDTILESNETFNVNLSNPTNATIADGTGVGTINNDDVIQTYTITASVPGGHGTATADPASVNSGGSSTITLTPDVGCHLSALTDNGADVLIQVIDGTYTISNINASHTVIATFSIDTFTLTYTAGDGGSINGDTSQTVAYNTSGTAVTAEPDTGYHFVDWSDGSTANPRTDINVTSNITVTANFSINTYTITASAPGGNGTATANPATVNHNGTSTVILTPETGYHLASLTDNDADVWSLVNNGTYTINNITSDHTVVATFSNSYIGTTTSVTSDWNPIAQGITLTFTATVTRASGSNTPTGTVTFKDGTSTLGTGTLSGTGGTATATYQTASLSVGDHSITAEYGGDGNFTGSTSDALTQQIIPNTPNYVVTKDASSVGTTGATLNGALYNCIIYSGSNPQAYFEWGTDTSYGYDTFGTSYPYTFTLMSGNGPFSYTLSSLSPGTTYHFRAVVKYWTGPVTGTVLTHYGDDMTFTTVSANSAPVATDVNTSTDEDTATDITLTASDVDEDSLSYSIVTGPSHGSLGTVSGNLVTYTPAADYNGSDSFTFKANDGTVDSNTATVNITINAVNDAPDGDFDESSNLNQSVEYSDPIANVFITATDRDSSGDDLTAEISGSPDGITIEKISGGTDIPGTAHFKISGIITGTPGTYHVVVTVSDNEGGSYVVDEPSTLVITVNKEKSIITFGSDNPVSVQVANPGDPAVSIPEQEFIVHITQQADDYLGTQNLAWDNVTMSLNPVDGGSSIPMVYYSHDSDFSDGIAAFVFGGPVTSIPIGVYTIEVNLSNTYYQAPQGEDVFVVYDPSLGFTTGGGWFYWPDDGSPMAGVRTNFGFNMKYNKKATNVQGSLLLIAHLENGDIYRIKSNALYGLALSPITSEIGWASFSGKCTYMWPVEPGVMDNMGGQVFKCYVTDGNNPGDGVDTFWFDLIDQSFTLDADGNSQITGEQVEIIGGNIVVPHTPARPNLQFDTGITDNGEPVEGSLAEGFTIEILGDPEGDMHLITLDSPVASPAVEDGEYAFYLKFSGNKKQQAILQAALLSYFEDKTGNWDTATWLEQIGKEIDGSEPFFYLKADSGTYTLVDNFKRTVLGYDDLAAVLTIDDDYPVGTYSYTGTLVGTNGATLKVTVVLNIVEVAP